MMSQGGNKQAFQFGKNRARLYKSDSKSITFKDVAGLEEEKEELRDTYDWLYSEYPWDDEDEDPEDVGCHPEPSAETYDWYNRKMFDYRGLIPMGSALEAPEGMYN